MILWTIFSRHVLVKFIQTYLLHFGCANLHRYCCQRRKEFQQAEADKNLQKICYDR